MALDEEETAAAKMSRVSLAESSPRSAAPRGKHLEVKSPMGTESAFYDWPLKKGKGSMKRSEVRSCTFVVTIRTSIRMFARSRD